MNWYGDDDHFATNLKREFVRWDPTRRAATLRQTADIIAADDGVTLKRKAQLMGLRRDLDDLDKEFRWLNR